MRRTRRRKRTSQKKIIIVTTVSLLLFLTIGYAAFSTQLSLKAKGNIVKKITVNDYVLDGLFAMYDGIENTQSGHGTPTDTWYNKALDLNPDIAATQKSILNNFSASNWTNDNGLKFNGTDNLVDTGYKQEVLGNNITLSFVVYTTSVEKYHGYFGYHRGPSINKGFTMQYNDGNVSFGYYGEAQNCSTKLTEDVVTSKLLNQKVNITVVLSAQNRVALYINGEKVAETACTIKFEPYPDDNFTIGKTYAITTTTNRYFEGTMYNFMVYKKELTDDEIKQNYETNKERYELE